MAACTGGNSGIGLAAFAAEGARVVITGRDVAALAWAPRSSSMTA
jgi:short-subunit dehydrogenase involved in D-alanine esterification of teichoic acids